MIRSRIGSIVLTVLIVLFASTAEARRSSTHGEASQRSAQANQAGVFDYYLLTLSWSPTYCLTHASDSVQCGGKGFGFVLHGLWPQYATGGYPQDCVTAARLTPAAIGFGKTIFPSPKLIDHEWSKHGTCSGLDAMSYFKAADQARTGVKVPAPLDSPAQTAPMTATAIAAAFADANPGIPTNALAVACSGPELAEVRVCLDRNLSPTACGNGVRSNCRGGAIRVPASH